MADERATSLHCAGYSALGDCQATPQFAVHRTSGKPKPLFACGRHLSWLVKYRTVPGHSVMVTRLGRHG